MLHEQEIDVKELDQNQRKQMFHNHFYVHSKDDIDHMVMKLTDQDDSYEEYQARTYLHQSLASVSQ
jgi:hypothetical protein